MKPITRGTSLTRCQVSSDSPSAQHVAREELALALPLLAAAHLHDLLGRDEDLAEAVLHTEAPDALLERALDLLLKAE